MNDKGTYWINNKSIFHFFHILANKISRVFVLRVACHGTRLSTLPVSPSLNAFGLDEAEMAIWFMPLH